MKVGEKEINKIADLALSTFMDLPKNISFEDKRGEVSEKQRRAIAYLEAVISVLKLDVDVDYYKQIDYFVYELVRKKK